jgi:uncharacterized membrane protein
VFGLTALGVFHIAISLVALASGFAALAKHREISFMNRAGQVYLFTTLVTAATALGIFRHGGFGPPHALAVMTLAALIAGSIAAGTPLFGRWSRYVQALSYSSTILFHLIPGVTETLTRLPHGAPLVSSPGDPVFRGIYVGLFAAFLVGVTIQLLWLRANQLKSSGRQDPR